MGEHLAPKAVSARGSLDSLLVVSAGGSRGCWVRLVLPLLGWAGGVPVTIQGRPAAAYAHQMLQVCWEDGGRVDRG